MSHVTIAEMKAFCSLPIASCHRPSIRAHSLTIVILSRFSVLHYISGDAVDTDSILYILEPFFLHTVPNTITKVDDQTCREKRKSPLVTLQSFGFVEHTI